MYTGESDLILGYYFITAASCDMILSLAQLTASRPHWVQGVMNMDNKIIDSSINLNPNQ